MDAPGQTPTPPFNHPLGVFESLVAALRVYFANANTLFVITAIFVIPATIVTVLLVRLTIADPLLEFDPNSQQNPFEGLTRTEVASLIGAFVIGIALNLVISMIAIGACFRAIQEALSGQRPDWRSSIRAALDRVRSLLWLPVVISFFVLGGLVAGVALTAMLGTLNDQLGALTGVALFVAGVYLFVSWSVAVPVLMAEDRRGMDAISRSRELVKGEWWPTLGVYVLALLLIIIVSGVLSAIFNLGGRDGTEGLVLSTLASVVNNVLFTPLQAALVGVVYLNLALKKAAPASSIPG